MKIQDILEGKFSKSQYAYHGTSSKHLRSIIKNGLIPNKSEGGYGSDDASLDTGLPLTPLSGTYFTIRAKEAQDIARDVINWNEIPVVIVCKVQRGDFELDEDRMIDMLDDRVFSKLVDRYIKSVGYSSEDISDAKLQKIVNDHIANVIVKLRATLDSRAIHNIKGELQRYYMELAEFMVSNATYDYAGNSDADQVKQHQDALTKKMKLMYSKSTGGIKNTFKVNKPIGFSGANKIVGIYMPDEQTGWGDTGGFEPYHKYKTPLELLPKS